MRAFNSGVPGTVQEVIEQMEHRLSELMVLRASPDMYGSELLDGQVAELELWLARLQSLGKAKHSAA